MKKRILVIDDDEDIVSILNIIFESEGYEVVVSRKEATVEEIQLFHPDIVLLDVMIKGSKKTGDQICKEIKSYEKTKGLPVVLISAEFDVASLAARSGADTYISKPFDVNDVVARVKEILA
jgi:DNA-binding response OmpR family regulator